MGRDRNCRPRWQLLVHPYSHRVHTTKLFGQHLGISSNACPGTICYQVAILLKPLGRQRNVVPEQPGGGSSPMKIRSVRTKRRHFKSSCAAMVLVKQKAIW